MIEELICGDYECSTIYRHKIFIIPPEMLQVANIEFTKVIQYPGEIIITLYGAYHWGFNSGFNVCESMNLASPRYIEVHDKAVICHEQCTYGKDTNITHRKLKELIDRWSDKLQISENSTIDSSYSSSPEQTVSYQIQSQSEVVAQEEVVDESQVVQLDEFDFKPVQDQEAQNEFMEDLEVHWVVETLDEACDEASLEERDIQSDIGYDLRIEKWEEEWVASTDVEEILEESNGLSDENQYEAQEILIALTQQQPATFNQPLYHSVIQPSTSTQASIISYEPETVDNQKDNQQQPSYKYCNICCSSFSRPSVKVLHDKTYHGEYLKFFVCGHCSLESLNCDNVVKHHNKRHPELPKSITEKQVKNTEQCM